MTRLQLTTLALATAALFTVATAAEAVLLTTGEYDENTVNTNSPTEASGNPKTLANFKSDMLVAFARDRGGVIDFEDASGDIANLDASYGVSGSKTMPITEPAGRWFADARGAISGVNALRQINGNVGVVGFNFGSIVNGELGEYVAEAGLSVKRSDGQAPNQNYMVTAEFTNGATDVRSFSDPGGQYVFVQFVAPRGNAITSILIDDGDSRAAIDDFAFITSVPEPASLALLGLGGLCLIRRRRR